MLVLDLKVAIFLVLLAILLPVAVILFMRGRRQRAAAWLLPADVLTVLESTPFGLVVLAGSRIIYANEAGRWLLGLAATPGDLPEAEWRALLEQDRAECRLSAASGARYRTVALTSGRTARWWLMAGGNRDYLFLLDVTAQQQTEQAGRTLINDLGHELRTPIATMLTHLEILGLHDLQDDLRQQSLALARSEAQRMARLVNDLLELGRIQTAEALVRRPVDLADLVEQVMLQVSPTASDNRVTLSIEADPTLPWVYGNSDRLRQVFLNLVGNAIKYAGQDERVLISLQRATTGVACTVTDSGPGVPPEHLPYLARRFYRVTPDQGEGSGLGLAMVAEILRRHDSTLELRSPIEDGRGFSAGFVLSLAEKP